MDDEDNMGTSRQDLDYSDGIRRIILTLYNSGVPLFTKDAIRKCAACFSAFRQGASRAEVLFILVY
jgi:hypothetical protein